MDAVLPPTIAGPEGLAARFARLREASRRAPLPQLAERREALTPHHGRMTE